MSKKTSKAENGKCAILARVEPQVRAKLKARAKRERRSLSGSVEMILIQAAALEQ